MAFGRAWRMAKKQELEITISETGEITLNVLGMKGKKCMDLTRELEESLGVVKMVEHKVEFYEEEDKEQSSVEIKDGKS